MCKSFAYNSNTPLPFPIKCFNCGEEGHPSFKYLKPLITCTVSKRLEHSASQCKRLQRDADNKNISKVKFASILENKYIIPIVLNRSVTKFMLCRFRQSIYSNETI